MQNNTSIERHYRFVIKDIMLLHLKYVQYLTYDDYPQLTETEIIELNDLYNERETYAEFQNDGNKYKIDLKELIKNMHRRK